MAAYMRATAAGLSSAGLRGSCWTSASPGTSRPAIAIVCAGSRSGSSGHTLSALRSRSAASTNGSADSPSWQRATSTVLPAPTASARSSSTSLLLPLPAWPTIATARPRTKSAPGAPADRHALRSADSSAVRPTSGQSRAATWSAAPAAVPVAAAAVGSGGAASLPARTSSYSWVVSGNGRTARSLSSTCTSDRYCRMAADRCPVHSYSLIIAWWAGSCSWSSCSQRRACPIARSSSPAATQAATSRCRPLASSCFSSSRTDACQSSKSGQSRTVKPARKSSRYRPTPRSSAAASLRVSRVSNSRTSTSTAAGTSPTVVRVIARAGPTAAAATDRVRLSDPRALASSASGHSRSATCSLVCSRPVTASSASSAMAFLVSNVTGAPSRLTTGGPSNARLNSLMRSPPPWTALSP